MSSTWKLWNDKQELKRQVGTKIVDRIKKAKSLEDLVIWNRENANKRFSSKEW